MVARVARFDGVNMAEVERNTGEAEATIRPMVEGLPGFLPDRSQLQALGGPNHTLLVALDPQFLQLDGRLDHLEANAEPLGGLQREGIGYDGVEPDPLGPDRIGPRPGGLKNEAPGLVCEIAAGFLTRLSEEEDQGTLNGR